MPAVRTGPRSGRKSARATGFVKRPQAWRASLFRPCETVYRPGHAPRRRYRVPSRPVRTARGFALHRRRHRIHAGPHLLAAALPGAAGVVGRGGGGGRAGAGYRSGAADGVDARSRGPQGVPRRAPGHRDLLSSRRADPGAALRHPGRRDGVRLRRSGGLRETGREAGARLDRQDPAFHRLGAATADPQDVRLRDLGRHPSARRLREDRRPARAGRARELAGRGDEDAHRSGNLSPGTVGRLAPAQDTPQEAPPAGRAARGRGVARNRGAAARRSPKPRAAGRGVERGRGAGARNPRGALEAA